MSAGGRRRRWGGGGDVLLAGAPHDVAVAHEVVCDVTGLVYLVGEGFVDTHAAAFVSDTDKKIKIK